jgi:hypothetical protein
MLRLRLANEIEIKAPAYAGDLKIPVRFIYDAFIIQYVGYNKFTPDGRAAVKPYVFNIRDYIVEIFTNLMRKQVKKYLSRPDRIRKGHERELQEIVDKKDASRYGEAFYKHTVRSLSHTDDDGNPIPNKRWGQIADKVQELRNSPDPASIVENLTYAGGLYNLIHNTETPVLDKFENGRELTKALNKCNDTKNYKLLLKDASPELSLIVELAESNPQQQQHNYTPTTKQNETYLNSKPSYKNNPNYYGD